MKKPYFEVIPDFNAIQKNHPHVNVLIAITSPEGKKNIVRKNIAVVIDISGSMAGAALENAIAGACHFVENCQDHDQVSIIAYNNTAKVVVPVSRCTEEGKMHMKNCMRSLVAGGGTALYEGWVLGAHEIAPYVSEFDVSRVIVLSDGQANVGEVNPDAFSSGACALQATGISTSTFGLGYSFNEHLMTKLSCGGQAAYAENSSQLIDYFSQEMFCLKNSSVRRAQVSFSGGELLNDLPVHSQSVLLPDGIRGGRTWCVVKVPNNKGVHFTAEASWHDASGARGEKIFLDVPLANKNVPSGEFDYISERVKEIEASRLQKDAAREAQAGRWDNVRSIVGSLRAMSMGNEYVTQVACALDEARLSQNANVLSKEALYASSTMNTRTVGVTEDVKSMHDAFGMKKAKQGVVQKSSTKENKNV